MFYSLKGTLVHKEKDMAVISCAGIGFECRTSANTLASLGETGDEAQLYTYMQVTQDGVSLFGFSEKEELTGFKMLLSVSGVGPKAALAVLSEMDPKAFALAVATGDHKQLTKVKGVGPKMAQRIVLELTDKITKERLDLKGLSPHSKVVPAVEGGAAADAVDALMVLGYSEDEAVSAVRGLDKGLSAEELIRGALKSMAKFK